jgi:integrase
MGRKVWTVAQLQTFLRRARLDRFFALWVLEATSGIRRSELAGARRDRLDLEAGTLAIEATRVSMDGKVVESDGKTENAGASPGPVYAGGSAVARRNARARARRVRS